MGDKELHVGDVVRFVPETDAPHDMIGREFTIKCVDSRGCGYVLDNEGGTKGTPCNCGKHNWTTAQKGRNVEIIKSSSSKTVMETITSLTSSFVNLFTTEPMKSFKKAGIVDGDNLLTKEGEKVFINWLFSKNQEAFNTEVVQPILAEKEAKK